VGFSHLVGLLLELICQYETSRFTTHSNVFGKLSGRSPGIRLNSLSNLSSIDSRICSTFAASSGSVVVAAGLLITFDIPPHGCLRHLEKARDFGLAPSFLKQTDDRESNFLHAEKAQKDKPNESSQTVFEREEKMLQEIIIAKNVRSILLIKKIELKKSAVYFWSPCTGERDEGTFYLR
jgi:hypothetical protein